MVIIYGVKAVPFRAWLQVPALWRKFGLVRLPDVKEPALNALADTFDLLAETQRALDGVVDQALPGVAFHHRRRGFN